MDRFIIRKYKKLYLKEGKAYLFDVPALVEAMEKKIKVSTASISDALELVADDEAGKERMASRIRSFLRGNEEIIGINTIQLLGLAFGDGNKMAFLEEIEIETITQSLMERENGVNISQIKEVYKVLYDVLYEIDKSCNYNFVPGIDKDSADAFSYYEKRMDAIRCVVNTRFLDKREIREKLIRIIDETEYFVKSYSIPGVVKRWKEINKRITYFDVVYDICTENYKLYEAVCNRKIGIEKVLFLFDFLPTEKDFEERNKYFSQITKKVDDGNLQYSYEKVFRNELLQTLEKVFEHDFPEIKQRCKVKQEV